MTTLDEYSARVLDVVDAIPPGQVMSYGDIAEYLGAGGPRQVGRVLASYGGGVAWWRVIHADGTPAPGTRPRRSRTTWPRGRRCVRPPAGARGHAARPLAGKRSADGADGPAARMPLECPSNVGGPWWNRFLMNGYRLVRRELSPDPARPACP